MFRNEYPYLVRGDDKFITDILPTEVIQGRLYLGISNIRLIYSILSLVRTPGDLIQCTLVSDNTRGPYTVYSR